MRITSLIAGACMLLLAAVSSPAADFSTVPHDNHGAKWRVGYLEGGPYFNYRRNLEAMVYGLMHLGWIEPAMLPDDEADEDTAALWKLLATEVQSDYIEFVDNAWYSAGWDPTARAEIHARLMERLNTDQDIDLMIAAGTWAGQDLANNEHHCPVLVFSVSDPVLSGILKGPDEALYPHVHAKCDPDRCVRMVRFFRALFRFKTLGLTYEDSPEGRAYEGVADFERAARDLGFSLVHCHAPSIGISDAEAEDAVAACMEHLSTTAEAVMIPVHRGVRPESMARIMAPLLERKIPTMTQHGSLEVRYGALLGMTLGQGAFRELGIFHARTAASIFNGRTPGELPQVFEDPRQISINLETARIIGWDVPKSLLMVADEVYPTIAGSRETQP